MQRAPEPLNLCGQPRAMREDCKNTHRQVGNSTVANAISGIENSEDQHEGGDALQAPGPSHGQLASEGISATTRADVSTMVDSLDYGGSRNSAQHLHGDVAHGPHQADFVGEEQAQGYCRVEVTSTASRPSPALSPSALISYTYPGY